MSAEKVIQKSKEIISFLLLQS